jgi:hypothetical protein
MNRIRNAKKHTIDGVLFLEGVFKRDCKKIEDFFTDRLLGDGKQDMKMYDRIPMVFTGLDTHPKSTNILCWNCNRTFKTRPWFEPLSIDFVSSGVVGEIVKAADLNRDALSGAYNITCSGNFCGPYCVRRWIDTYTKNMADRLNKISMLKFVYEIFMGRKVDDIPAAPRHIDQVQYGGHMSASDYQKKLEDLDQLCILQKEQSFADVCKEYVAQLAFDG